MKYKISFILAIILIVIILLTIKVNANANAKFKLLVNSVENIKSGEKITLKINLDNISKDESEISGIKFDVFYDKDNLEFVSAKKLNVASGSMDLYQDYPEEGRIRIGLISLTGINKSGELYEITLKTKELITKKEVDIRIETKEVIDKNNNEIECEIENGIVKFEGIAVENTEQMVQETEANQKINKQEKSPNAEQSQTNNATTINNEENEISEDYLNEEIVNSNVNNKSLQNKSNFVIFIILAIVLIAIVLIIFKKKKLKK